MDVPIADAAVDEWRGDNTLLLCCDEIEEEKKEYIWSYDSDPLSNPVSVPASNPVPVPVDFISKALSTCRVDWKAKSNRNDVCVAMLPTICDHPQWQRDKG